MALCNNDDINLEILSWVIDFELYAKLSVLNKKSYILIVNTPTYAELDTLKTYAIKLNDDRIIRICYELGLINILKKLKKNNKHLISGDCIEMASEYGHVNILEWLKNSGLGFKYNVADSIIVASTNGHINILDW